MNNTTTNSPPTIAPGSLGASAASLFSLVAFPISSRAQQTNRCNQFLCSRTNRTSYRWNFGEKSTNFGQCSLSPLRKKTFSDASENDASNSFVSRPIAHFTNGTLGTNQPGPHMHWHPLAFPSFSFTKDLLFSSMSPVLMH